MNVNGKVQIKESRTPLADLIINLYVIDSSRLGGRNRAWHEQIGNENIIKKAADDVTDENGRFLIRLDPTAPFGSDTSFGMIILAPDDEDSSVAPLYISSAPKRASPFETLVINISQEKLKSIGYSPTGPRTITDLLKSIDDQNSEISNWLRNTKKVQSQTIEDIKRIKRDTVAAFEQFRPSTVPSSIQESGNYIKDKGDLKKALHRVRSKAINELKASRIERKRRLIVSKSLYKTLALEANKTIKLDARQLRLVTGGAGFSREELLGAVRKEQEVVSEREKLIVDRLIDCLPTKKK